MKSNIIKGLLFVVTLIILISFIFSLGNKPDKSLEETTEIDCSECEKADTCDKVQTSDELSDSKETESSYTPKEFNTTNSYLTAITCPVGKTSPCKGSGCGQYVDNNNDGYCDIVKLKSETTSQTTSKKSTSTPTATPTSTPTKSNTSEKATQIPTNDEKKKSSDKPTDKETANPKKTDSGNNEQCPLKLTNDPYPGKCDLYTDENNNKICDLSEDEKSNTAKAENTNSNDSDESNNSTDSKQNPQIFLSSLMNKTSLTTKSYNFLNSPNTKIYILLGILILAGIFMFFRIGNRVRFSLLIISAIYFGFLYGPCLCFLGTFQTLSLYPLTKQLPPYTILLLFIIPIIFALFFGRIFCGSACPFGAVQEVVGKIGHAADVKTKKYPSWFKYLKYLNIIIFTLVTIIAGSRWFCKYDPFLTFFTFSGNYISVFLLGLFLATFFAFGRSFCKYLCPYGALLGIISKISLFKYKITNKCKSCIVCQNACPTAAVQKGIINHMECIRCGICKEKCPVTKKQTGKTIDKNFKQDSFKRF